MRKLSAKQLKTLGCMSSKAFKLLLSMGAEDRPYDEWRHAVNNQITGRSSWKELVQGDYIPLLNAYRRILGLSAVADNTPRDAHAANTWMLIDRCRFWEMSVAYVAAIAADKFSTPELRHARTLDEVCSRLDARQVFELYITVKARARARDKRETAHLGMPPSQEAHASPSTMPPPRLAAARGDTLLGH